MSTLTLSRFMSRRVKDLLCFGFENDLEVISYGLAPNPNGFCFESHGKASDKVKQAFHERLESLNSDEIEQIKKAMFT